MKYFKHLTKHNPHGLPFIAGKEEINKDTFKKMFHEYIKEQPLFTKYNDYMQQQIIDNDEVFFYYKGWHYFSLKNNKKN